MAAPKNSDNWKCCYYEITGSITCNGSTSNLKSGQVTGFMIEKEFDTDHLPVILIDLSLDYPLPDDIKKDPSASIHLRVDKCIGDTDNGIIEVTNKTNYINDVFNFVVLDDTPKSTYYDKLIGDVIQKQGGDYSVLDTGRASRYILVKQKDAASAMVIPNIPPLTKTDLTNAIGALLTNSGCTDVVMANLDNWKTYKELVIPPIPLIECLKYLKNKYGFHREDTVIFMDVGTMYIVRKNAGCSAYRAREATKIDICLNAPESIDNKCSGVIYTDTGMYINVEAEQFKRLVGGAIRDQTVGTNVLLYDRNKMESATVKTENDRAIGNNTNIREYSGHNLYVNDQIKCRSMEEQYVFSVGCVGADISAFTPNKQFSIISNCAEISIDAGGRYRLAKCVTTFTKSGNYMLPTSVLTLKLSTT